jgi:predicted DNA-binding transcriptional regulator AlpA
MAKSSSSSSLLSTEDTRALRLAIETAITAALQERKRRPAKPPPASKVKRRGAKAAADPKPSSSKHGFRGVPPPLADVSLAGLPADQLLTEFEVAALTRLSTSTFEAWRKRPDHPLKWTKITGGRVRYRAGDVRQFIESGYRPQVGRPRKEPAGTPTTTTEIHTPDAAPGRHRTSRRPRAAAAPQEASS